MASQQLAAAVMVSLAASMASAYASPCSSDIDRIQGRIDAELAARAATAPSQKESTDALLHRQLTPKSVGAAHEKLRQESGEMVQIVERAMALARAADAAGDKGACEQALADAQRAIAWPKSGDPDSGNAKINHITIGHAKPDGRTAGDTAIGSTDAADTRSTDPKFYRERGMAFYRIGDLDRALADFNAAILLDPRSASVYIDRSLVFYRKAEPDRAFADIAQAIRIEDSLKAAARPHGAAAPPPGD